MIIKTTLEKNGFLGTFYEGSTYADKAVIYVGGRQARTAALWRRRASKLCSREGFSVLALGYYLWEGLSKNNFAIPVDYCERAVGWLKNELPREDKQDRHDGHFPWGSIYAALRLAHWRHNLRHTRFGL